VFYQRSPLNHRDDVDDVILLFTDGHPSTLKCHKLEEIGPLLRLVDGNSTELKEKNVTIIGVAAGQKSVRQKFTHFIKNWTTLVFETDWSNENLENLTNTIVDPLCGNPTRKYLFMIEKNECGDN
jgi:hypothetical protein